jgi:hypothetical protein
MRLTFPILAALLALPALAQWNRYASSGKGEAISIAEPRPLSYFTGEGRLRDDSGNVYNCEICTPAQKAQLLAEAVPEVSRVGKVGEYTIYDILYVNPANSIWGRKSILVQTTKDQYREISYIGNGNRYEKTSIIGDLQPNQMLYTATGFGIMGASVEEQFWVGDGMSVRLDLKAVAAAQEATMSAAGIVRQTRNREIPEGMFEPRGHDLPVIS